ncbi:GNAT family N-acetyltransferase [Verrucomicrobiota bacterium]
MRDGDLRLLLAATHPGDARRKLVPWYEFEMRKAGTNQKIGVLKLRVGSARLLRCPSHIGYGVDPGFRGNHYAARSVRLVLPFAAENGIKVVWITCKPDNMASRRTCELAGLTYVETIRVPKEHRMYREGYRYLRRHRISLRGLSNKPSQIAFFGASEE